MIGSWFVGLLLALGAPPPPNGTIRDFCKDEAETARIHAFEPQLGLNLLLCDPFGVSAELALGKRTLTVVAGESQEPTHVDLPPARVAHVALDGHWLALPPDGRATYLAALAPLGPRVRAADVRAFLQMVLLAERVAYPQIVSAEEQAALVASWPRAQKALAEAPAGLSKDGRTLRVWEERTEAGLWGTCRVLMRHEVTLTKAGRIVLAPLVTFYEGKLTNGRPCGTPLPE